MLKIFIYTILFVTVSYSAQGTSDEDDTLAKNLQSISTSGVNEEELNLRNVPIIDANFDTEPLQSLSTIGVQEEELNLRNVPIIDTNFSTEDTPDTSAKNLQSISTSGVNEEDDNPIQPIIKTRISLLRRRGNKPLTINTPTTPTGIPDDELIRPIIITNSPLQIKRPRKGLSGATTKKKEISLPLKLNLPNVPIIDTNFDAEPSHNILQSLLAKKLQSISTIGVKEEEDTPDSSAKNLQSISTSGVNEEDDNPIQPIIKTRIPLLQRRGNKLLTINTPTTPTDITEDTPDTSAPKNTPSSCEIKKIENQ